MKKRKIFSKLLSLFLVLTIISNGLLFIANAQESEDGDCAVSIIYKGDVNSDGKINMFDYLAVKNYTLRSGTLSEEAITRADVNADSKVNMFDYALIKSHCLEKEEIPPSVSYVHNTTFVPATEATCTKSGNIAYYHCNDCGKYFSDETCENEINLENTVVGTAPHSEEVIPGIEPSYDEAGLTPGIKCSVCGCILVEQESIDKLQPQEHSITFYNEFANPALTEASYLEHIGISAEELPSPVQEGYKFMGWYDGIDGSGTKIVYIPKGSTENYVLFAYWQPIEYTITYFDAPKHENKQSYTVEDEFYLTDPIWEGLAFAYWEDSDGNKISKISKGSIGDIELTARWKSIKNMAISKEDSEAFLTVYDKATERYHFIYELGSIQNIVLDTVYTYKYDGSSNYFYSISEIVSVQEEEGYTASEATGKTVTKSDAFETIVNEVTNISKTENRDFTFCPEIEFSGIKTSIFEASLGANMFKESEYSTETSVMNTEGSGIENSISYTSTIAYIKNTSTTVNKTVSLKQGVSPAGLYSYVFAGDAKVYAIVSYDPKIGDYYVDIYSMIYRTFDTTIFELQPEFNLGTELLPADNMNFTVPVDNMKAYVDSSYYVKYDANGGEGEYMPMSVHTIDSEQKLYPNTYYKTGYTFAGWQYTTGDTTKTLSDQAYINNLAEPGQSVVLYAIWSNNEYEVIFDANGGTVDQSSKTVNYDKPYGSLPIPERPGYTFDGWMLNSSMVNESTVVSSVNNHTLIAKWTANSYTITFDANGGSVNPSTKTVTFDKAYGSLPTPTKSGYKFMGWTLNTELVNDTTIVKTSVAHTLIAVWERNVYDVIYHPNGGSGSTETSEHTYDIAKALTTNGYSRLGWTFLGWNTDPSATTAIYKNEESVKNLTDSKDSITLYAIWSLNTSFKINYPSFSVARDGTNRTMGDGIDLEEYVDLDALKAAGYTNVTLGQKLKVTKTSSDTNAYVVSRVFFDEYNGILWQNSPDDVSTGGHYTNIHLFSGGSSSANLDWSNTRALGNHTVIFFAFTTTNPWSIFDNYKCSYDVSNYEMTISFSK